jgi:type I restriction enzyme S subunit
MAIDQEERIYLKKDCAVFKSTHAQFGELSNMAANFPIFINGYYIKTSEAIYQAMRYPHLPDIQKEILDQGSPMTAKMKSRKHYDKTRADWMLIRVPIMKWCLKVKFLFNKEKMISILQHTKDKAIVEESKKDSFWGAKPLEDGTLKGTNALGRCIMELREIALNDPQRLHFLNPPSISNFSLFNEPIGNISAFDVEAETSNYKPAFTLDLLDKDHIKGTK